MAVGKGSTSVVTLSRLLTATVYNISVSASTSVGKGNYSDIITTTTLSRSKCSFICSYHLLYGVWNTMAITNHFSSLCMKIFTTPSKGPYSSQINFHVMQTWKSVLIEGKCKAKFFVKMQNCSSSFRDKSAWILF